ncbi:MAG: esterase-like activity of phytase family protein [Spongiibacteraceae bacterium]
MNKLTRKTTLGSAIALSAALAGSSALAHDRHHGGNDRYFQRIATFPVFKNLDTAGGDASSAQTVAEISAASRDGKVVYYSDSPQGRVGLVDIANPARPQPGGFIALDGEPTSVAVHGDYLLVALNTSASFVAPSGKLVVYSIKNPLVPTLVTALNMGGQPDSIAISPDGTYAAVIIENERDEDINDGLIPQAPGGFLNIVKLHGKPQNWQVRKVDLSGLAAIAPSDPEPEYVSINKHNIAAVTLQENNHIALVDLRSAKVIKHFSAGTVDLIGVDTDENDAIEPVDVLYAKRREPDAIAWVDDKYLATANEGDYADENGTEGGSRSFTLFHPHGEVAYESGASFEQAVIRAGHYPESRSENKGVEPEGIAAARFEGRDFLFVGSERGNIVGVYTQGRDGKPQLHQLLPSGVGPEGLLAIPQRNLFVVSAETDDADTGFRSTVSIYSYGARKPDYPQIVSTPHDLLPWGALSGLVADNDDHRTLFAVPDSYYKTSRIFRIETDTTPAQIVESIELRENGNTVDYDLEGIAQRADGGFWLASEGNGSSRPNLLVRTDAQGHVLEEINLPAAVIAKQKSNGFEGVAVVGSGVGERVLVAFQREWSGDPAGQVRIGVYRPAEGSWGFFHYPLDVAAAGTWNGLSEITAIDADNFMVIERDNQQGEAAKLKRLYRFSIAGLSPAAEGSAFPLVSKKLVRDLLPDLKAGNGWVVDKVEGAAIAADGRVYVVTDNDGVEDATGETRFLRLGKLLKDKLYK